MGEHESEETPESRDDWQTRRASCISRVSSRQIDYEYPKTPADAEAYVRLLRELRAALSTLAKHKGRPEGQYQLTVAAPCGGDNMQVLRIREMDQVRPAGNQG